MARYRKSSKRRTPIKNSKTYKKGQMQAALVTFLAVAVFIKNGMVQKAIQAIQDITSKVGS
tara:strand:- start:417 stop:599 length:183 start_codon:yes stop_codon:yes gene_type:complete